jgi:hypothetical protein
MFQPEVFISLTTIPSRVNRILQHCLDGLMLQTYPVTTILLTIPKRNMRGQKASKVLPTWLSEEPYRSKITLLRPETDYGPICKYIGGVHLVPENAWVFVGDDDQQYVPDGIARMVAAAGELPQETRNTYVLNSNLAFESTQRFSFRLISGFLGVFVPASFLRVIDQEFDPNLPLHALRIDDDLVSIYARDNGFFVHNGPCVINWKHYFAHTPKDGLGRSYNRFQDRHLTHMLLNPAYVTNLRNAVIVSSVLLTVLVFSLIFTVVWGLRATTTSGVKTLAH